MGPAVEVYWREPSNLSTIHRSQCISTVLHFSSYSQTLTTLHFVILDTIIIRFYLHTYNVELADVTQTA